MRAFFRNAAIHFRLILRFATGMSGPDEKPDLELGDWGGTDQSRDFETSANLSTRVIRRPLLKRVSEALSFVGCFRFTLPFVLSSPPSSPFVKLIS